MNAAPIGIDRHITDWGSVRITTEKIDSESDMILRRHSTASQNRVIPKIAEKLGFQTGTWGEVCQISGNPLPNSCFSIIVTETTSELPSILICHDRFDILTEARLSGVAELRIYRVIWEIPDNISYRFFSLVSFEYIIC
jgi:hypothetical protein